jgi:hypothetical protein
MTLKTDADHGSTSARPTSGDVNSRSSPKLASANFGFFSTGAERVLSLDIRDDAPNAVFVIRWTFGHFHATQHLTGQYAAKSFLAVDSFP